MTRDAWLYLGVFIFILTVILYSKSVATSSTGYEALKRELQR
jgi:hypothetical protein